MPRQLVRDFGTALQFGGGVSSYVTPATRQTFTGEFSIACWFNWRTDSSGGFIFGDTTTDIKVGFNANLWFIRLVSAGASSSPTPIPRKGMWNFFVLTRDSNNKIDLYINGVGQRLYSDVAHPGTFAVGYIARSNVGQNFLGKLDNVATWNRGLTGTEAANLYYNGTIPSGVTLYYKFDEGSGTSATDSSGNSNTGTHTGDVTYTSDVPTKLRTASTTRPVIRNFNAALSFDGVDDYVSLGSVDLALGNTFTCAAWVKPRVSGSNLTIWSANNAAGQFQFRIEPSGVIMAYMNGVLVAGAGKVVRGAWNHIVYARNGTGNNHFIQLNGVNQTLTTAVANNYSDGTSEKFIGMRTFSEYFNGSIAELTFYPTFLSDAERKNLYFQGVNPGTKTRYYKLDEGAGTAANDSSGNANHGTITGATYTSDVPMKSKLAVNNNLVRNGDFGYTPPFVAATTTSGWIDGTAAGSSSNDIFGWRLLRNIASVAASFDSTVKYSGTNSLKISTTDTTGAALVRQMLTTSPEYVFRYAIPILPNTSYTASAWIKMNNVQTGSKGLGVRFNGSGTVIGGDFALFTSSGGTSDWTNYVTSFTTGANDRYLEIRLQNNVAGNISDIWFDDIELKPTTPTTRSTV